MPLSIHIHHVSVLIGLSFFFSVNSEEQRNLKNFSTEGTVITNTTKSYGRIGGCVVLPLGPKTRTQCPEELCPSCELKTGFTGLILFKMYET